MKTLARHVRKADFAIDSSIYDRTKLDRVLACAVTLGLSGFPTISLKSNMLRGKAVYQLADLAEILVIRHITSNIRRVTGVKQDDRQLIIKCMQKVLCEGTSFRIYKFDIALFYESVSLQQVFEQLENDIAFSGQSIRALRSFFVQIEKAGALGLPRGLSLSATLAEYLLRDFDKLMSNENGVWFYARFVDDIMIITDGQEDVLKFKSLAAQRLPSGLKFNKKSISQDFTPFTKTNRAVQEHHFDFLGSRFSVGLAFRDRTLDNKIRRDTWLDIAPSKVRKLKTRIARSLIAYSKDHNFALLLGRFQLLTSNFNFLDLKTGVRRASGIYYNYPLTSVEKSVALLDLDRYLLSVVTSPHSKNRLRPIVTVKQRQQLLNLRFQDGFRKRRFFSFNAAKLGKLTACWIYA